MILELQNNIIDTNAITSISTKDFSKDDIKLSPIYMNALPGEIPTQRPIAEKGERYVIQINSRTFPIILNYTDKVLYEKELSLLKSAMERKNKIIRLDKLAIKLADIIAVRIGNFSSSTDTRCSLEIKTKYQELFIIFEPEMSDDGKEVIRTAEEIAMENYNMILKEMEEL